ncbi:hypothetical protein EZS27_021581 [termite gut metagenome]|uniref:Uncharacterized protein n=1 Tax=termite gut metagenome TaxID=433724 RepID=A0A5J4R9K4_9ZZZZ
MILALCMLALSNITTVSLLILKENSSRYSNMNRAFMFCSVVAWVAFTLPVYKPKTVYPFGFLTKNTNFFMGKLPAIGNITFSTYWRFISIKKRYLPLLTQFLKFFELFHFIFIISRLGLALTAKSYAFVSSTRLFKKRTSVLRLTDFTLCNSHSAFAACKR